MSAETIGARIRSIRKELHMTQKEFAERIGITQAHLSGVENNKDNPSESVLRIICNEFNIGIRWLKLGEGEKIRKLMSKEEFISKLPLKDRPESEESDLLFILMHPISKVREEFFDLSGLYRQIITTCDMPNGFDFLVTQTLDLVLNALHDCFSSCSTQIQLLPDEINKEEYFSCMGKISTEIMNCKHDIIESLDDYQTMMRDRINDRIIMHESE